jgi:hypothetical protein
MLWKGADAAWDQLFIRLASDAMGHSFATFARCGLVRCSPNSDQTADMPEMVAKCHNRTHAPQQK